MIEHFKFYRDLYGSIAAITGVAAILFGYLATRYQNHMDEYQANAEKRENAIVGDLIQPDSDQKKPNDSIASVITIKFGQITLHPTPDMIKHGFDIPTFLVTGQSPIRVRLNHDGKLFVSGDLYDWNGDVVARIVDNQWKVNNNHFERYYDDTGFEVVDRKNIFRIRIEFQSHSTIYFEGFFNLAGTYNLIGREEMMFDIQNITMDEARAWSSKIQPLFNSDNTRAPVTKLQYPEPTPEHFVTEQMFTGRSRITSGERFTDIQYRTLKKIPDSLTTYDVKIWNNDIESMYTANAAIEFFTGAGKKLIEFTSIYGDPPSHNEIDLRFIDDQHKFVLFIFPKNKDADQLPQLKPKKYRNLRKYQNDFIIPDSYKSFALFYDSTDLGSEILAREAQAMFEIVNLKFDGHYPISVLNPNGKVKNQDKVELLFNNKKPDQFGLLIHPFR